MNPANQSAPVIPYSTPERKACWEKAKYFPLRNPAQGIENEWKFKKCMNGEPFEEETNEPKSKPKNTILFSYLFGLIFLIILVLGIKEIVTS